MNRREIMMLGGSAAAVAVIVEAKPAPEMTRAQREYQAEHRAAMQACRDRGYERFLTLCNLCPEAVEEAALGLGPAFVYELRISDVERIYARNLCRELAAEVQGNPLAAYINIVVDERYAPGEWSLHANGKGIGST